MIRECLRCESELIRPFSLDRNNAEITSVREGECGVNAER